MDLIVIDECFSECIIQKCLAAALIQNITCYSRIQTNNVVVLANQIKTETVDRRDIRVNEQDNLFLDPFRFFRRGRGGRKLLQGSGDSVFHFSCRCFCEGDRKNLVHSDPIRYASFNKPFNKNTCLSGTCGGTDQNVLSGCFYSKTLINIHFHQLSASFPFLKLSPSVTTGITLLGVSWNLHTGLYSQNVQAPSIGSTSIFPSAAL